MAWVEFTCRHCHTDYGAGRIPVPPPPGGTEVVRTEVDCPQCGFPNPPAMGDGRYEIRFGRAVLVAPRVREVIDVVTREQVLDLQQRLRELESRLDLLDSQSAREALTTAVIESRLTGIEDALRRQEKRQQKEGRQANVRDSIMVILMILDILLAHFWPPDTAAQNPTPEQINIIIQQEITNVEQQPPPHSTQPRKPKG